MSVLQAFIRSVRKPQNKTLNFYTHHFNSWLYFV